MSNYQLQRRKQNRERLFIHALDLSHFHMRNQLTPNFLRENYFSKADIFLADGERKVVKRLTLSIRKSLLTSYFLIGTDPFFKDYGILYLSSNLPLATALYRLSEFLNQGL